VNGNNRNIQNINERDVYYHKSDSRIDKIIEELNLGTESENTLDSNYQKEIKSEIDLDTILNNKNTKLKEILDLKKLR
jgi:hypothetical protein